MAGTKMTSPAIQALMAKLAERQKLAAASAVSANQELIPLSIPSISESISSAKYHHPISGFPLNEKQASFIDLILQGRSCVLIGAAGTGKTFIAFHPGKRLGFAGHFSVEYVGYCQKRRHPRRKPADAAGNETGQRNVQTGLRQNKKRS